MPPLTALGRISVARRFASTTNWWTSCSSHLIQFKSHDNNASDKANMIVKNNLLSPITDYTPYYYFKLVKQRLFTNATLLVVRKTVRVEWLIADKTLFKKIGKRQLIMTKLTEKTFVLV